MTTKKMEELRKMFNFVFFLFANFAATSVVEAHVLSLYIHDFMIRFLFVLLYILGISLVLCYFFPIRKKDIKKLMEGRK
ncbi:MAG: hypothetical protein DRN25_02215 [Thermoplasmata archaeon]|nr:MAG: hypothetical protein DRN25_02215 [Thermoplasmata archaeon]